MTQFERWCLRTWSRLPPVVREAAPLLILEHIATLKRVERLEIEATFVRFGVNIRAVTEAFERLNQAAAVTASQMAEAFKALRLSDFR